MDKPQLPIWLDGSSANKLADAAQQIWQKVESQLTYWLTLQQSESASLAILDLLAWERGITRIPDEALELYAKRVQLAQLNANDAGSADGLERIFKRLGFGYVAVNERVPGLEWDQVQIEMLETEFAGKERLVLELIETYGKTCRRYLLNALAAITTAEGAGLINYNKEVAR
ncbi:phage tail protein [Pseudoalteromonas sp. S16_S37]|uniref:phage tail protein n=1 Tax=Pseudoalteromonas sp. S16_S37 TaxID=2720228 RepID=UPI00167FF4E7|nr:phage tail protein [Pseudoalteromonas sp. S16_S37]MBD1582803.1 phage tail protein [Pseudoalteromonas sp. S16_S37]